MYSKKLDEFFSVELQESSISQITVNEMSEAASKKLSKKKIVTSFSNVGNVYSELSMCSMFIAGVQWIVEQLNQKNECRRNCVVHDGNR